MQKQYALNQTVTHSFGTLTKGSTDRNKESYILHPKPLTLYTSTHPPRKSISTRILTMGRSALLLSCFSLGMMLFNSLPSQAAKSSRSTPVNTTAVSSNPPVPPDLGAPKGRTGGGASRGTCTKAQAMRAVLPRDSNRANDLTALDHPTLWFYLPERPDPKAQMEFVLQDAADHYIYKTTFIQPNASAGLISINVPESAAPLTTGAAYNWTLSIQCDPNRPSQMSFIRGAIQRVAVIPNLSLSLLSVDQTVTARLYAQQGYWSDAITILAQTLQAQPLNPSATQLWKDLLARSGVTDLHVPSIAIKKSNLTEIGPTAIMP
jgi:Domain of Unknown Function (DUF928)